MRILLPLYVRGHASLMHTSSDTEPTAQDSKQCRGLAQDFSASGLCCGLPVLKDVECGKPCEEATCPSVPLEDEPESDEGANKPGIALCFAISNVSMLHGLPVVARIAKRETSICWLSMLHRHAPAGAVILHP